MSNIKVSFIVCTYSKELFPDTLECIDSLTKQDHIHKEILLVMGKNYELYEMFLNSIPASVNILIKSHQKL